jgi:hypothetical protein
VAERRSILLTYRSASANEWELEVDPWAVVVRFGRWYLLCFSHQADAIRTYRVDRILSLEETGQGFPAPDLPDPVVTLEEHLGTGREFGTRVVFDVPPDEVAPWIRPPMGRLEPHEAGCVLVGSTSNPAMYAEEWLSRLPLVFHVEGGRELRAAVAAVAIRLTAALPRVPSPHER